MKAKAKPKPPPLRVGDLRRHPRGYNVRIVRVYDECAWPFTPCALYVREPWIEGCRPATGHQGRVSKYPLITPSETTL